MGSRRTIDAAASGGSAAGMKRPQGRGDVGRRRTEGGGRRPTKMRDGATGSDRRTWLRGAITPGTSSGSGPNGAGGRKSTGHSGSGRVVACSGGNFGVGVVAAIVLVCWGNSEIMIASHLGSGTGSRGRGRNGGGAIVMVLRGARARGGDPIVPLFWGCSEIMISNHRVRSVPVTKPFQ